MSALAGFILGSVVVIAIAYAFERPRGESPRARVNRRFSQVAGRS